MQYNLAMHNPLIWLQFTDTFYVQLRDSGLFYLIWFSSFYIYRFLFNNTAQMISKMLDCTVTPLFNSYLA